MASTESRLNQLREERFAREKARIEKLRDLNLKKYGTELLPPSSKGSVKKNVKTEVIKKNISVINTASKPQTNGHPIRSVSATLIANRQSLHTANKPKTHAVNDMKIKKIIDNKINNIDKIHIEKKFAEGEAYPKAGDTIPKLIRKVSNVNVDKKEIKNFISLNKCIDAKNSRKSIIPKIDNPVVKKNNLKNLEGHRKSFAPNKVDNLLNAKNKESVFDRLYKPKTISKPVITETDKLKSDPIFLSKVLKDSGLITNKRHTVFETKSNPTHPVRRSISAVHFKRVSKNELANCVHKWSSIGEKLDRVHLKDISEDSAIREDKVISAIKSERKRVKFQTPIPYNYNTPRPGELQDKLRSWLQKRGKSFDSYHHLQCFGVHHLSQKKIQPLQLEKDDHIEMNKMGDGDNNEEDIDENKENIPVDDDSDNDSYTETINDCKDSNTNTVDNYFDKWRRASLISDSASFAETPTTNNSEYANTHHVDELLLGALGDLTELLKEGFDWEQCARWLRAIRERFPNALQTAAYWECRAALEERRGDLPASVHCWEEAVAQGTERSVVEANLDLLLDKFMQLKISPNSSNKRKVDPKLVDVKNVLKSTIIRFAVEQAKNRQSLHPQIPSYTVTPVRRSGRLSIMGRFTPRECKSVTHARTIADKPIFVPNNMLVNTP